MMKQAPTAQQAARLRAELIMKVRCGLITARQAAEQLGVSRKTYYKWEERGLAGLLSSLTDQASGRPCQPADSEKQSLERQLEQPPGQCHFAAQDGATGGSDRLEVQARDQPGGKKMSASSGWWP